MNLTLSFPCSPHPSSPKRRAAPIGDLASRLVFLLGITAVPPATADTPPQLPAGTAQNYRLVWQDEFEAPEVDQNQWTFRTGERFASLNQRENVSQSGGMLRLALKKEKAGTLDYTSGGLISKRTFKYGYYETSFRSPPGAGWHVSFWMMPHEGPTTGNRQEIDVCEHDSKDPFSYGTNLHIHHPKRLGLGGRRIHTKNLSAGFHTLGCEFTPTEIRTWSDGKIVSVMGASTFQHDAMNIWLTAVGWANLPWNPSEKIDDSRLPAFADFAYVRFYERLTPDVPAPWTVLAFGDSLTAAGLEGSPSWVGLIEKQSAGQWRLLNEGKGGRTTGQGKNEFDAMTRKHPRADCLVLALGTNDSRDLSTGSVEKSVSHLRHIISRARQCYGPSLKILIAGPPNLNKSALVATQPIAHQREAQLQALNTAFAALATAEKCQFISTFGVLPDEALLKDGVHPDAAGQAALAKVLFTAIAP